MAKEVNRKVIVALAVLVAAFVLSVVGFLTPGYLRYDYKKMNMGMFGAQEIRTDRFTGKTQVLGDKKWQPIEINGQSEYKCQKVRLSR